MHAPICSKPEERKHFAKKAAALPTLQKDRKTDPYSHKPQKLRQDSAEYAGELATLDTNIGKIVNALKESGQYDNTIIMLTGDNGGRSSYFKDHPTSNLPLKTGKTFLYEGGIRTPLLVRGPKWIPRANKITLRSPAWTPHLTRNEFGWPELAPRWRFSVPPLRTRAATLLFRRPCKREGTPWARSARL